VLTSWLLEYSDLHYTYPGGQQPALNGLTLRIPAGKKCALLGHNGCGKSTLFLHGNGILRPQKGQVCWKGSPISYDRRFLHALKQKIGLVFQDPEQQLIASTVSEDISYGLCNLNTPVERIKQKVEQIMAAFHLSELAHTPVHHLSLGQKKRVALAGVMALEPELLLLDEPTAYLDRFQTRNLLDELNHIHAAGTTVLLATHDLDVAYEWAEWIFIMDKGRLVLEGEPETVFAREEWMERLQLGIPQVLEIWQALPASIKDRFDGSVPRTVKQLRRMLEEG
jgi:cobalt/nickel transport system ATP-binding protein